MRLAATGRAGMALVAAAACAAACAGTSASPKPVSAGSTEQLSLDFANPPEQWRTVATFHYGGRADELGSPAATAIAMTGSSLWVADRAKRRVAHYTLAGRYLGEHPGLRPPATAPHVTSRLTWKVQGATLDIEMAGGWHRRYSLTTEHLVAVQVRSAQTVADHTYLSLGVAGAPTTATGGALLLELDGAGNVASLERVATPVGDDAQAARPFFVASNGRVYQWFPTRTDAELRVRP